MHEISAETIRRCQAGELEALEEIYCASSASVFRVALRLLGSHADAEDATQQVFLRLRRKISTFDGRSAFPTWLYRVTTNHCINLLRSRRTLVSLSEIGDGALRDDRKRAPRSPIDAEQIRSVQALLDELHPDDRAAIVLKDVEGLTYRELAAVLGVPPGTVMSRLHRARQRLVAAARRLGEMSSESANERRPGTCPTHGGTSAR